MISIFAELKRRNVFRVAGVYAVVGWLLMQAAALFENSMHLPAWFDSAVTAALLLGFPIAILLAWAFEMTPEGVKRTEALEGETVQSGRKMDGLIVLGMAAILGMGAYQQMTKPDVVYRDGDGSVIETAVNEGEKITSPPPVEVKEVDPASIAVLPFDDLSPDGDQGFFSDGISEELLNVLVRVDGLKVASRTSSFAFKGQDTLGIPVIAEQLNVRHVLEGSVRKSGNMIRITAQLIDANTDQHLWSETYDRTLTTENIFGVQDEISAAIVTSLREALGTDLGDIATVGISTENLDAYELFLKAHQGFIERSTANIPTTISLFEQAVAADPDFARAWAGLAAVYSVAPGWGIIDKDYYALSERAAQKAIALNPKLALPYAVLGNVITGQLPVDHSEVLKYFSMALALDPKDATTRLWRGVSYIQTGFFDLAKTELEKCLQIDPAYENCRRYLANTMLFNGETASAEKLFLQGIKKGSTAQIPPFANAYAAQGDFRSALLAFRWDFLASRGVGLEIVFDALTDPQFDFEAGRLAYERQYKARNGEFLDWSDPVANFYGVYFRNYEALTPDLDNMVWWDRNLPHFYASPHRKRFIRELGIYDYWREVGFPPQCRAVGSDDFECD